MVKILSAASIRETDEYTIKNEPITSIDLMERAATKATNAIIDTLVLQGDTQHFSIFCGSGNNGGDGLVMARKLLEAGHEVSVLILELGNLSDDCKTNLERFKKLKGNVSILNKAHHEFEIEKGSIVVDAIFGTGLNRIVEGFAAEVIKAINNTQSFKIAIDMPSGLFAEDNTDNNPECIFKADLTLSFQLPKLAFLFPENEIFVGKWEVLDIGLNRQFIEEADAIACCITKKDCIEMLPSRRVFSHKGNFGHALLMAGSKGKVGAAVLAAKGCLRSGIGLLSIQAPGIAYTILQTSIPEAMVVVDEDEWVLSSLEADLKFTALGIGPGIGQDEKTVNLLKQLIQSSSQPMVIDADALNILSANKTWISFLPKGSILTPHPGEFRRLAGDWDNDFERLELLKDFAHKHQLNVVLKGHYTTLAIPGGKLFFNTTGNSGMAGGGSGDVLTGIITALLAQGIPAMKAALVGVFVHGLAGDIAAQKFGERSMLPTDLVDCLAEAYQMLENTTQI